MGFVTLVLVGAQPVASADDRERVLDADALTRHAVRAGP